MPVLDLLEDYPSAKLSFIDRCDIPTLNASPVPYLVVSAESAAGTTRTSIANLRRAVGTGAQQ
jgi:hypothetical protein